MKPADVLQWVTNRDSSGGSPTRLKPAGGSIGKPACVWGNPGCGARWNEEAGRKLSPEKGIVVDTRITPELRRRGKADALEFRGRQQSLIASGGALRIPPGSENTACLHKEDLGTREIQHSPQRSRSKGSRVRNVPGLAKGVSFALPRAKKEAAERYRMARPCRSRRDGVLEVLAEHSTEGRYPGRMPGRSGRRGSGSQATRCREGEAGHNALTERHRGET